jgi:hypothetical protein
MRKNLQLLPQPAQKKSRQVFASKVTPPPKKREAQEVLIATQSRGVPGV